jgi:hypothetical protein
MVQPVSPGWLSYLPPLALLALPWPDLLPHLELPRLELPGLQQLCWFETPVSWFAISPPIRRLLRRQLQESRPESVSSLILL